MRTQISKAGRLASNIGAHTQINLHCGEQDGVLALGGVMILYIGCACVHAYSLQKWSSWWAMNASLSPGPYTAVQYGNMHTRPGPSPHGRPDCACGGDAADDGSGFTSAVTRAWAAGSRHNTTWLCSQSMCTPYSVIEVRVRKHMQATHTHTYGKASHTCHRH